MKQVGHVASAPYARGVAAAYADVVNPCAYLDECTVKVQLGMAAAYFEGFIEDLAAMMNEKLAKSVVLRVENVNNGVVLHFIELFRCKNTKKV